MAQPTPLVAGNWKMNGLRQSESELQALEGLLGAGSDAVCNVLICPPFPILSRFADVAGDALMIGAQDCHTQVSGAHTGDVSAEMIADAGATHVIVGHSERRADHAETSSLVAEKAGAAHRAGLTAIVCVGETETERDAGDTLEVVLKQLTGSLPETTTADNCIIAYEPVWAIGTGRTPTNNDIGEVHAAIRNALETQFGDNGTRFAILYGGSVKPANAKELMTIDNVNGALVGGASLKASDFNGIIDAYRP